MSGLIINPHAFGAAPFSPLDLSPVLWLDASDTSSIVESGGAVSQWTDKSGNGNHATQGTGALQPTTNSRTLNSLNTIDFTAEVLELPSALHSVSAGANTMFVVFEYDGLTTVSSRVVQGTINSGGNTRYGFMLNETGNDRYDWVNASSYSVISDLTTGVDNVAHLMTAYRDGTDTSIQIDANTPVTGSTGSDITPTQLVIGAKNYAADSPFNGAICEIILVGSKSSALEISQTQAYLNSRWGL